MNYLAGDLPPSLFAIDVAKENVLSRSAAEEFDLNRSMKTYDVSTKVEQRLAITAMHVS